MKTAKTLIIIYLLIPCLVLLNSCGDDPEEAPFIPIISAIAWIDQADGSGEHTFFFLVEEEGKAKSTFTGNENIDGVQDRFEGYYDQEYIEFSYIEANSDPSKEGIRYTGKIEGKPETERIVLTTPGGQLVLTR